MNLGKAIRELRTRRDMNQEELATASGVSRRAISQIENGARPSDGNLKKICKALQMPYSLIYFYAMEREDVEGNGKMFDTLFPTVKRLIFEIAGHNPEEAFK